MAFYIHTHTHTHTHTYSIIQKFGDSIFTVRKSDKRHVIMIQKIAFLT